MKFWQILQMGGIAVAVLFVFSIASITIIIERIVYFSKKSKVKRDHFMKKIRQEMEGDNVPKALEICRRTNTPFASVVAAALDIHTQNERLILNAMERQIAIETGQLERFTGIAGTVGSTAVYVGLLGTVFGIMRAFHDISTSGTGGINVVINGISEALGSTAIGLCVAVPAVIAYNYFIKKIDHFVVEMELCASETMDLIVNRNL
jgi:biopolymer transport protein ExbB/TolQ